MHEKAGPVGRARKSEVRAEIVGRNVVSSVENQGIRQLQNGVDCLPSAGCPWSGVLAVEDPLPGLPGSGGVIIAINDPGCSGIEAALIILPRPVDPNQIEL